MTKGKMIYTIIITLVFCIMTLGYAALQERVDVEVEASIDSTYRVEITRVQEGTTEGDARSVQAPSYNDLTATFNVGLTNDTDYITYTVEITNYSTVDIRLNNLDLNTTNNNMKVVKIGITNGDIILSGSTKAFVVKIKLETENSSEQTSTITVIPDFTRLKGGLGSVVEETYDAYEIGDIVSFAGSNWYVIEDSPSTNDYVVLLKETILTGTEIGGNYVWRGNTSNKYMAYYWNSTCHYTSIYGNDVYDSYDDSGCSGHNDFAGSKVKEVVYNYMMIYLDVHVLKEVDGYKIRLITLDELQNNLGLSTTTADGYYTIDSLKTPSWVYQSFGNQGYWTMSPKEENIKEIWVVNSNAIVNLRPIIYADPRGGVRPVINLYKSAID